MDIAAGRIVYFIAGQTSLDQDGELIGKNDFAAQAEQGVSQPQRRAASVGCTAGDLVKLTVFLRDMVICRCIGRRANQFFATVTPPAARR